MAIYPLPPGTPLYETRAAPGYRFRVERPLGQGGFGITYLADDVEFQGRCVIKEFALGELCARSDATGTVTVAPGREGDFVRWLERFEMEARQIHRIHHANVVRVRAVWRERGTAYYAMDLVEGHGELPSPDEEGWRPMRWSDAERVARDLLAALGAVHRQGLIHGDIKPSNVLLDRDHRPVLIDFGTVRTNDDLRRTVTSAMYTPGYAPPELTSRKEVRQAGPWSDLYSWAMVVWGLVADHHGLDGRPLDAASRIAVAQSGGSDRYTTGSAALTAAGVPASWAAALVACLELDTAKRPASVDAVEAMVRGGARGATVVEARAKEVPTVVERPTASSPAISAAEVTGAGGIGKSPLRRAAVPAVLVCAAVALVALALPGSEDAAEVSAPAAGGAPMAVSSPAPVPTPPAAPASARDASPSSERAIEVDAASASPSSERAIEVDAASASPPTTPAEVPAPRGMVRIRAGTFTMGSPSSEFGGDSNDEVQRTVTLTRDFWLGATEVTQSEYQSLMGTNPSRPTSCGGNCPVAPVSWLDAVLYANARSRAEGLPACYDASGSVVGGATIYDCMGYRLPTEAEWEYAARAGTTEMRYGALGSVAWYSGNAASRTHPVQGKAANAWGLYDMLGNVWEWTHDWYGSYDLSSTTDPLGPVSSSFRVFRGCSCYSPDRFCRAANRNDFYSLSGRQSMIGFRLARTAPSGLGFDTSQ